VPGDFFNLKRLKRSLKESKIEKDNHREAMEGFIFFCKDTQMWITK